MGGEDTAAIEKRLDQDNATTTEQQHVGGRATLRDERLISLPTKLQPDGAAWNTGTRSMRDTDNGDARGVNHENENIGVGQEQLAHSDAAQGRGTRERDDHAKREIPTNRDGDAEDGQSCVPSVRTRYKRLLTNPREQINQNEPIDSSGAGQSGYKRGPLTSYITNCCLGTTLTLHREPGQGHHRKWASEQEPVADALEPIEARLLILPIAVNNGQYRIWTPTGATTNNVLWLDTLSPSGETALQGLHRCVATKLKPDSSAQLTGERALIRVSIPRRGEMQLFGRLLATGVWIVPVQRPENVASLKGQQGGKWITLDEIHRVSHHDGPAEDKGRRELDRRAISAGLQAWLERDRPNCAIKPPHTAMTLNVMAATHRSTNDNDGEVTAMELWHTRPQLQPEIKQEVRSFIAACYVEMQQTPTGGIRRNTKVIDQLTTRVRLRAQERGAREASLRDVREVADSMIREQLLHTDSYSGERTRPLRQELPQTLKAEDAPVHQLQIDADLRELHREVQRHYEDGHEVPRVLIVGERQAITATKFAAAGAFVLTCDLHPSESETIPHYRGDFRDLKRFEWHLVICHPPCTYLANPSVGLLHREPGRWDKMQEAARLFKDMYAIPAPFVVVENPIMHGYAKHAVGGCSPTQYVNPWQHGTPQMKTTGLYLSGTAEPRLPALRPSHEVAGRQRFRANLPPSPDRGALRSRTFPGVAAAMALQWLPAVLRHIRRQEKPKQDGDEMFRQVLEFVNTPRPLSSSEHYDPDLREASVIGAATKFRETEPPAQTARPERQLRRRSGRWWRYRPKQHVWARLARQRSEELDSWLEEESREDALLDEDETRERSDQLDTVFDAEDPLPPNRGRHEARWTSLRFHDGQIQCLAIKSASGPPDAQCHLLGDMGRQGEAPMDTIKRALRADLYPRTIGMMVARREPEVVLTVTPAVETPPTSDTNQLTTLHLWAEILRPGMRYTGGSEESPDLHWVSVIRIQDDLTRQGLEPYARALDGAVGLVLSEFLSNQLLPPKTSMTDEPPTTFEERNREAAAVYLQRAYREYSDVGQRRTSEARNRDIQQVLAALPPIPREISDTSRDETPTIVTQGDVQRTEVSPEGGGPNSAFIRDFRILCRNGAEGRPDTTYEVSEAAYSFMPHALADTGAGPSIISQRILDLLPPDAAVRRVRGPEKGTQVVDVQGGQLLLTHMVHITFLLNGLGYEHVFQVLEGGELIILGNDFLRSHGAVINMGGDCSLKLPHCNLRRGELHTVPLRTVCASREASPNPERTRRVGAAILPQVTEHKEGVFVPPPKLVIPDLSKLVRTEHLLFSEEALIVPARRSRQFWLKMPKNTKQHGHVMVTKIPSSSGLSIQVEVQNSMVQPNEDNKIPI